MDRYETLALLVMSLFLIPIGWIVYWIISIIRSPKLPPMPPIETEPWVYGGRQFTITYRKGARPEQGTIDEIKNNIGNYETMIAAYLKQTEKFQGNFKEGLELEGISFPIFEDDDFDFSIDYMSPDNADMSTEVCFKNGKVQSLTAGD